MYFPALSEDGWVTDPEQIADYLFAHFFASNFSQSPIYTGSISSMAWCIHEGSGDIAKTINILTQTLTAYFGRHYANVTVNIKETPASVITNSSKVELSMFISLIDASGKVVSIGRLLEMNDTLVTKITKYNNE